jgi:hypothetical protein
MKLQINKKFLSENQITIELRVVKRIIIFKWIFETQKEKNGPGFSCFGMESKAELLGNLDAFQSH